jgi:MFS family permease
VSVLAAEHAAALPPDTYDRRRNASFLVADLAMFLTGMAFASPQTLLPAFAERLGAPNVVIGAIPALMSVGWTLPSIFAANHAQGLERKLPFIVRFTIFERLPYFILGAAAIWLALDYPTLTLALLLAMLLSMTVTGGVLMPAWLDVIGSVVPATTRGRFFAVAHGIGALLGVGGAAGVGYILERYGYPLGYGFCFLIGAVFLGFSYIALLQVREPPSVASSSRLPTAEYVRKLPRLVREDRNLLRLIVARSIVACGQMATGFYTAYALKELGAADAQVGLFTLIVLATQTVGNVALGWLADRRGHVLVLSVGALGTALSAAVALVAPSVAVLYLSFAGMAIGMVANSISGFAIGMEIGPEAERPTYTAINNSSLAPFQLVAPIAGGLLADAAGYAPLFALAMVLSLVGAGALRFAVRDPRRT